MYILDLLVNPNWENPTFLLGHRPVEPTQGACLLIPLDVEWIHIIGGVGKHAKPSCTLHVGRRAWMYPACLGSPPRLHAFAGHMPV